MPEQWDMRTSALLLSCSYAACSPLRRSSAWCRPSFRPPTSCRKLLRHVSARNK